jgi:iron complex transport system substrate-binding protein
MKKIFFTILFLVLTLSRAQAGPRYISLAPSTTEILFALGLDREIAGVSSYCNYPEKARTKRSVGDFSNPNMETIIALKPDYIFCTGLEQDQAITELRRFGLKVYVADPASIKELFDSITAIGAITGKVREADSIIRQMRSEIAEVSSKVERIPLEKRMKVFIEIWNQPLMTAGAGSFIDELVTTAGGINVARDVVRPYCNISPEKVVSFNPQCIIMAYMDKEPAQKIIDGRLGWDKIDAVKNNRVYNDINPDILLRPGPRITRGIEEIYKRLYKE